MRPSLLALSVPLSAALAFSSGCAQRAQATREAVSAAAPAAAPLRDDAPAAAVPAHASSPALGESDAAVLPGGRDLPKEIMAIDARYAQVQPVFDEIMSVEGFKKRLAQGDRRAKELAIALREARINVRLADDALAKARSGSDRVLLRGAVDEVHVQLDAFAIHARTAVRFCEILAESDADGRENDELEKAVREAEKLIQETEKALQEALKK